MLKLGINGKVTIFSLIVIVIFASCIGYTLQLGSNESLQEEFISRGQVITRNLAFNTKLGLVFQDKDNLQELANGIVNESGVELVLILDAEQNILIKHGNESSYDPQILNRIQKDQNQPITEKSKNRINFLHPVINDSEIIGTVIIGLSTNQLLHKINTANTNAVLITLLISVIAIASIVIVAGKKLKQLQKIKDFAEQLASGQHGKTIELTAKDEIGELATSLNIMSEKIEEALTQAETNYKISQESAQSLAQAHDVTVKEKSALADAANRMQLTFDRIKNGDLTQNVTLEDESELSEVATGLNNMLAEFSSILTQIRSMTHSLERTSQTINDVSNQITAGADRQHAQTESITASVKEMAYSLDLSQEGIKKARTVALKAQQKANDGGVVVHQAIDGINRIAQIVDDSTSKVRSLGEQSQQINDIVQVIEEIADQTNLLALNAAIEAARAGEQGRGFAVVADEVRKLAERTSHATGEIASLIKKVSQLTDDAVKAMNTGNSEMKSGRDLVQNIGAVLQEIVGSVESIQNEFEHLVEKSQEQHRAGEQISGQIDLIQEVAQQNTSYVQEVRDTGNDFQTQISTLVMLVSRFRTAEDADAMLSDPAVVNFEGLTEENLDNFKQLE